MGAFLIRTARPEDAERLSEIYRYYVENTAVSYEYKAPDAVEFERRIRDTLKKYPYIVAESGGGILGYAYAGAFNTRSAASRSAEVSIYVDRDVRRNGLGRALYAELERLLAMQNVRCLVAKVAFCHREQDPFLTRDSIEFHRHCGYRTAGAVENCGYKFGHWYGLMFMQNDIGEYCDDPGEFIGFDMF